MIKGIPTPPGDCGDLRQFMISEPHCHPTLLLSWNEVVMSYGGVDYVEDMFIFRLIRGVPRLIARGTVFRGAWHPPSRYAPNPEYPYMETGYPQIDGDNAYVCTIPPNQLKESMESTARHIDDLVASFNQTKRKEET